MILQQKLQRFQLLITNFTNQRQYFTAFSKNAKESSFYYQKLGSKWYTATTRSWLAICKNTIFFLDFSRYLFSCTLFKVLHALKLKHLVIRNEIIFFKLNCKEEKQGYPLKTKNKIHCMGKGNFYFEWLFLIFWCSPWQDPNKGRTLFKLSQSRKDNDSIKYSKMR